DVVEHLKPAPQFSLDFHELHDHVINVFSQFLFSHLMSSRARMRSVLTLPNFFCAIRRPVKPRIRPLNKRMVVTISADTHGRNHVFNSSTRVTREKIPASATSTAPAIPRMSAGMPV